MLFIYLYTIGLCISAIGIDPNLAGRFVSIARLGSALEPSLPPPAVTIEMNNGTCLLVKEYDNVTVVISKNSDDIHGK